MWDLQLPPSTPGTVRQIAKAKRATPKIENINLPFMRFLLLPLYLKHNVRSQARGYRVAWTPWFGILYVPFFAVRRFQTKCVPPHLAHCGSLVLRICPHRVHSLHHIELALMDFRFASMSEEPKHHPGEPPCHQRGLQN